MGPSSGRNRAGAPGRHAHETLRRRGLLPSRERITISLQVTRRRRFTQRGAKQGAQARGNIEPLFLAKRSQKLQSFQRSHQTPQPGGVCATLNTPLSLLRHSAPIRHIAVSMPRGVAMAERILIVDDDPVQRRLLENMVTRAGYEAIVLDGGDAAATLLTGPEGAGIDAVVLDLMMPDLDGLGVLGRIRDAGL